MPRILAQTPPDISPPVRLVRRAGMCSGSVVLDHFVTAEMRAGTDSMDAERWDRLSVEPPGALRALLGLISSLFPIGPEDDGYQPPAPAEAAPSVAPTKERAPIVPLTLVEFVSRMGDNVYLSEVTLDADGRVIGYDMHNGARPQYLHGQLVGLEVDKGIAEHHPRSGRNLKRALAAGGEAAVRAALGLPAPAQRRHATVEIRFGEHIFTGVFTELPGHPRGYVVSNIRPEVSERIVAHLADRAPALLHLPGRDPIVACVETYVARGEVIFREAEAVPGSAERLGVPVRVEDYARAADVPLGSAYLASAPSGLDRLMDRIDHLRRLHTIATETGCGSLSALRIALEKDVGQALSLLSGKPAPTVPSSPG